MPTVDLRSDTVTQPTNGMRMAMAAAPLGDDVFGEDPTVNRLQDLAADRLGKEAGLFVSSGTMGNLLGLLAHASRGDEVIADADSHVLQSEGGGLAALANVLIRPLPAQRGVIAPQALNETLRPPSTDLVTPQTTVVSVENTHQSHDGAPWPLEDLRQLALAARQRGLKVHMDGARMFNAAVAMGVDPAEIAAPMDTVTFCLSKGLGCPIGSVLVGPLAAIDGARRWRKLLGGGTRQAGLLAAAGIWALDHHVDRLAEDHARARRLGEGLAQVDGLHCQPELVETNIVFAGVDGMPVDAFVEACRNRGLLMRRAGWQRVRLVTHLGIDDLDVGHALTVMAEVMRDRSRVTGLPMDALSTGGT
jgi:threonine aldolase